ncbi:hypothetical protein [Aeribacillus pallidus]|uniref:hypothetical protein n=1 Tax=Aeribacillus pallidus TaxID=33936 RepID=UPI003D1F3E16
MKKTLFGVIAFIILGTTFYINESHFNIQNESLTVSAKSVAVEENRLEEVTRNERIEEVVTEVDFEKIYNNVEELMEDATVIIEGKVLETSSVHHEVGEDRVVFTKVNVKVSKVYTGDVKAGQELTFIEPGGMITKEAAGVGKKFKDYPKEKLKEKVKVVFNGVPNMEKNDKVLLFGVKSDFPLLEEEHYGILGAHQGKFNIKNGKAARYVPDSMDNYLSLEMDELDVDEKIKKLLKEKDK